MPIVTVQTSIQPSKQKIESMIQDIRSGGAKALGCGPDNLWVVYQPIPVELASEHPPVVTIQANVGRSREVKTKLVKTVTAAVAEALSVPSGQVWVYYQELDPREIWFQDRWSV